MTIPSTSTYLETQEQVDPYLAALKAKLTEAINNDERVEIR